MLGFDPQAFGPTKNDAVPVAGFRRQADRRETIEQTSKCDARLQNCQRRAEAVMDTASEGEMAFSATRDVEVVGVREGCRVPVRRAEQGDHLLARANTQQSTVPHGRIEGRTFRVTHPFHPLHGREFELIESKAILGVECDLLFCARIGRRSRSAW